VDCSTLYIDGRWFPAETGATFPVFDPCDGHTLAQVSDASPDDVQATIAAAKQAFPAWAARTAKDRGAILHRAAGLLRERSEALALILSQENGKPLAQARGELGFTADFFEWFAEEGRRAYGSVVPSNKPGVRRMIIRQPIGVVAVISPWNLPAAIVARKVAPVLAAGCTCVLKPAEQTPLSAIEIVRILEEAGLPPGVLNLVTCLDPAPVGEALLNSPDVARITFTGSVDVGRDIAREAAWHMKRFSLELGGHAPFIVFDDADLERAVEQLIASKFRNSGQTCLCANRIFVHRDVMEPFTHLLVQRAGALALGRGTDPGVSIGPMIDADGFTKVRDHVQDATKRGARCLLGGQSVTVPGCEAGLFFPPTVLVDLDEDSTVCHEETFGPVAALLPFDDEAEVLERANRSIYGLSGYAFTRDLARAFRVAEALECGIIGINEGLTPTAECPFGGVKHSGVGREGGWQGLDECLETKYITFGL
jgi:succinate-semialdehyde dehydrogenase / glutarate-semialdehyde dehydrogenase